MKAMEVSQAPDTIEFELSVEEIEEIIAPALNPNHNETLAHDISQ